MKKSEERLKKEGYQVFKNVVLEGKSIKIDLMGVKDSERFGVDCIVKPTEQLIKKRKKVFQKHLTKLVFAIPSFTHYKPKDAWEFEIKIGG